MLRTHNCGELRKKDIKSNVILSGWAHKIRDKGKVIWIDIRDRYGITPEPLEGTTGIMLLSIFHNILSIKSTLTPFPFLISFNIPL